MRVNMRGAASAALAVGLMAGLAGCEFISPQQTMRTYAPSDGVNSSVGGVDIRDALLITDTGTSASLVVSLYNNTASAKQIHLQYTSVNGAATQQVDVPAGTLLSVRPGGAADVTLTDLRVKLGSLFPVGFTIGSGTPVTLQVPVLDNSLPGYGTLTPTPAPTPTFDFTTSPSATATPQG